MSHEKSNTSRRRVLHGGLAILAAGAAGTVAVAARPAAAQEKLAQSLVLYQDKPNDGAKCVNCLQWVAPDACKVVDGKISPEGWCVAFAPKT